MPLHDCDKVKLNLETASLETKHHNACSHTVRKITELTVISRMINTVHKKCFLRVTGILSHQTVYTTCT